MLKKILVLCTLLFTLTCVGCGSKESNMQMQSFEIPMDAGKICRFRIPADWSLSEYDGFCYWEFNDGEHIIQRSKTSTQLGDKKGNCYYTTKAVTRNFDAFSITISTTKDYIGDVGAALDAAKVEGKEVTRNKSDGLQYLPEFSDYDMVMSENGLLVPPYYNDVTSNVFTSAHSMSDNGFYTTWLMNYKFSELEPVLNAMLSCNNGATIDTWFQNDDIYYAKMGNLCVGAKKLTYNKWCCFISTAGEYENYLLKGLYLVTNGD